jgi:tetratricopeptide (TPR) repeat protein
VLTLFLEGKLAGAERASVGDHVKTCSECVFVLGETSRFLQEQDDTLADEETHLTAHRKTWWLAVAAAVAAAFGVATWQARTARDPIQRLAAAAKAVPVTSVEGRLEGFPPARFDLLRSKAKTSEAARLRSAARDVVDDPDLGDGVAALHARGVAELLLGDANRAVASIGAACSASRSNAGYWSDLAAAQIEAARRDDRRARLRAAIQAADRALALNRDHAPALFNRAVARESLGYPREAAADFRRAAALEPGTQWSKAAERRADGPRP